MPRDAPRLGRGLRSLISIPSDDAANPFVDPVESPATSSSEATAIPVDQLAPNPFQPRKEFDPDRLRDLVQSITASGVIQPVVVRRKGESFEIIAGERRWRAAREAGLTTVPAVIRKATDGEMLRLALIENIQREDLNAIDRAQGYRAYGERFGLSAEQMAEEFGENRTTITNYVRLLNLADPVQALVAAGSVAMGHARALLGLSDPQQQTELANLAIERGLSVRQIEEAVRLRREAMAPKKGEKEATKTLEKRPHIRDLEERLGRSVGTKVVVNEGRTRHTGRIVIEYYSLDDFDRITERLGLGDE